jgi:hypothetical protein
VFALANGHVGWRANLDEIQTIATGLLANLHR